MAAAVRGAPSLSCRARTSCACAASRARQQRRPGLCRRPRTPAPRALGDKEAAAGQAEHLAGDDAEFVVINDEDEAFGPPAVVLASFLPEEALRVREALDGMGADFVRVSQLGAAALDAPLVEAFNAADMRVQSQDDTAMGVVRLAMFSGLVRSTHTQARCTEPEALCLWRTLRRAGACRGASTR